MQIDALDVIEMNDDIMYAHTKIFDYSSDRWMGREIKFST